MGTGGIAQGALTGKAAAAHSVRGWGGLANQAGQAAGAALSNGKGAAAAAGAGAIAVKGAVVATAVAAAPVAAVGAIGVGAYFVGKKLFKKT